ncbi:MAG: SUF system Fe-S cluster assembly protein [Bacteroidales bacterium]|nr:SUF system Fe-S cluster assembly protein [Bacteroidales bacterium]
MEQTKIEILKNTVVGVLKNIYDPEIPVNIYDLGLIYKIDIDEKNNVNILMTLTSPNCPVAENMPAEVNENVKNIKGVNNVKVELTFEPPWDQENISNEAKLELGLL